MPEVLSRELEGITTQAAPGRARPCLPAPHSALGLPGLGNALGCSSALLTPKAAMRRCSVRLFVLISAYFLETGSRQRRHSGLVASCFSTSWKRRRLHPEFDRCHCKGAKAQRLGGWWRRECLSGGGGTDLCPAGPTAADVTMAGARDLKPRAAVLGTTRNEKLN